MANLETDIDEVLREQIKSILAEQDKGTGIVENPTSQPAPIEVTVGGQKFSFKDNTELSSAIERTIAQAQQAVAEARGPAKPDPVTTGVSGDDKPDWSFDKFVEQMGKDPREAIVYALEDRFGKDAISAVKELKEKMEELDAIKKTLAAEQFRQLHPEFPVGNQAAGALLDKVRTELNLPFNLQGLEAAYYMSVNQNPDFRTVIQQNLAQIQQMREQFSQNRPTTGQPAQNQTFNPLPQQAFNPYLAAPPTVSRTTQDTYDPLGGAENLSLEQLEKLLSRNA